MGIYDKFKNLFQIKLKFNSKPFKSFIMLFSWPFNFVLNKWFRGFCGIKLFENNIIYNKNSKNI